MENETKRPQTTLTIEEISFVKTAKGEESLVKAKGTYGPNKEDKMVPLTLYMDKSNIKVGLDALKGAVLNSIRFQDSPGKEGGRPFIHCAEAWVKMTSGKSFHYEDQALMAKSKSQSQEASSAAPGR